MHDATPNPQRGTMNIPNPPNVNLEPNPLPPNYPGASTQNLLTPANERLVPEIVPGSEEATTGSSRGVRSPVFVSSHHRIVLGRIVSVGPPGAPQNVGQGAATERVPTGSGMSSTSDGATAEASESRIGNSFPPGPPPTFQGRIEF